MICAKDAKTSITFSKEQKHITIKITDESGKEVKSFDFSGKQLTIEKGDMPAGVYFVQVIADKKKCCK